MNMFRSALFKLTAIYAAIVMSICIVFSVALYHVAVQELHTGIYNQYTRLYNVYEPFGLRQPRTTPSQEVAARSHHILLQIFYLNLVVLLLAGVASYLVARRTLRPIEAAHEQQKRFTADVSHELRTPLTSLRMESEVALMSKPSSAKELRQTLQSNLEEVAHMETLINNLLLLSSMEANKIRSDFSPLSTQSVVSDAVSAVATLADTKQITINHSEISGLVIGDQASLTQLFAILIENAIKYSPAASRIDITSKVSKGKLVVSVVDSGGGIPLVDLPRVFDRFYRSSSARTVTPTGGSTQGFGLGLSLAKLIADLHGAEIIITSTPGTGTNASVVLPRLASPRAASTPSQE